MEGLKNDLSSPAVDFFLTDSLLTDDERAVRDRVRDFAETELRPVAAAGLGVGDLSGPTPPRACRARHRRGHGEWLRLPGAEQRRLRAGVAGSEPRRLVVRDLRQRPVWSGDEHDRDVWLGRAESALAATDGTV